MARTTHVAKAQQRYETVPVIDPTTGEPKQTPVMRNGEQRKTKKGKPIFMTVTMADKTKPLPPEQCDFCHQPIEVGMPYKHITPKSGPYGGRKRSRHETCPGWMPWDYSNSLSAQTARIAYEFGNVIGDVETEDDVQSALDDAAADVREIAEQKRESASNIEDGFGHPTSQSEELEGVADELDGWADEIESVDIPEQPEREPVVRWYAHGPDAQSLDEEGYEAEDQAQAALDDYLDEHPDEDGDEWEVDSEETGEEAEELTEEQMSQWRDEVIDATSIVDECPV